MIQSVWSYIVKYLCSMIYYKTGFHEKTVLRFDSLPESCKASILLGRHLLMKATILQACGAKRPLVRYRPDKYGISEISGAKQLV